MESDDSLRTRRSLISRLKSWDDHDSWREFFDAYWRLIYHFSLKSGLNELEAHDVVQETMVSVAREMPKFRYDSKRGSFKSWLLKITRARVVDRLRQKYTLVEKGKLSADDTKLAEELEARTAVPMEDLWEDEWRAQLLEAAIQRVKLKVKPEQFQVFDLLALRGYSGEAVSKMLGLSRIKAYVVKHRVEGMIRKEVRKLQQARTDIQ